MATKMKRLTPATRPRNKTGRCGYCCEIHRDSRDANDCYYFVDAYYGFDKDWNCLSEKMPKDFKKFSPEDEAKTIESFLKLGYLCDKLVKYVEFHKKNDVHDAFDCEQDCTDPFVTKVTGIATKAVQKAKESLEGRPKLPKRIKDKLSILDDLFQEGFDIKIITKMAEFEEHKEKDIKILRSTYEALADIYATIKKLGHYAYCQDHGSARKIRYESDCEDIGQLQEEMNEFELAEYWQ